MMVHRIGRQSDRFEHPVSDLERNLVGHGEWRVSAKLNRCGLFGKGEIERGRFVQAAGPLAPGLGGIPALPLELIGMF